MKVRDIRTILEQWAKTQNRGCSSNKQADALLALSQSLAPADKLTITTMLNKIENNQVLGNKQKKH